VVLHAGEHPLEASLAEQLARLTAGRRRFDVLVLPDASWTVQQLADACVEAASVADSVRCRLATGDREAWRAWAATP
jgi:hypothetical protein